MTILSAEGTATSDGVIRQPQADVGALQGGPWDGCKYSYIPNGTLAVDCGLKLHETFDTAIDPITYQVLRSRFWHNNLEHGDVIRRIAGSFTVVFAYDFAVAQLTENGDVVTIGPTIQYFATQSDLAIKWTLENRSAKPGIADGDIFLQNDAFVAGAHQADVAILAPVFWEGELFSWVYNCCHIGDMGGIGPRGVAPTARDIFDEAVMVPPLKIVDHGELRVDLLEAFARQSREPGFVALGVKSQIAGVEMSRGAMLELLQQYGPETVKGAMRRSIADTSKVVSERLQQIPDGRWRERIYVGGAAGTERTVHQEVITLTKRGDRIVCTNEGTSPQTGPGNATYAVLRSSVVAALMSQIAPDQLGCTAGVANQVSFVPVPGTRTSATHPAAVSALFSTLTTVNTAGVVVSKMVLCGPPELRARANASGGVSVPSTALVYAYDDEGNYISSTTVLADIAGAIGALPYRDGIDTGGAWWLMGTRCPNVEEGERGGSLLVVFRGEARDSGGPGRWRGGNGPVTAFTPHRHELFVQMSFIDPAVNTAMGLGGGYYGQGTNLLQAGGESLRAAVAEGRWPSNREELEKVAGGVTQLGGRAFVGPVPPGDVIVIASNGAGGFGDPLDRDPQLVRDDVDRERISRAPARIHYGVVIRADGTVDDDATAREREEIRSARLGRGRANRRPELEGAEVVLSGAAGSVDLVSLGGRLRWACGSCREDLGAASENFKLAVAAVERNPHGVDAAMYPDPAEHADPSIVLRQYLCPGCAHLLSQEFCPAGAEPVFDVQIGDPEEERR